MIFRCVASRGGKKRKKKGGPRPNMVLLSFVLDWPARGANEEEGKKKLNQPRPDSETLGKKKKKKKENAGTGAHRGARISRSIPPRHGERLSRKITRGTAA